MINSIILNKSNEIYKQKNYKIFSTETIQTTNWASLRTVGNVESGKIKMTTGGGQGIRSQ